MLGRLYRKAMYLLAVIANLRHWFHYEISREVTAHDLVIADLDYIDALEAKTLWDRIKGIVYLYSVLYRSRRFQLTCNHKEHRYTLKLSTVRLLSNHCPYCWLTVINKLQEQLGVGYSQIEGVEEIAAQIKLIEADGGCKIKKEKKPGKNRNKKLKKLYKRSKEAKEQS